MSLSANETSQMLDDLIGCSPVIERFRRNLPCLSKNSSPLILIGEQGIGKAFLAAHIHAASLSAGFMADPLNFAPIETLNFSTLCERDQRLGLLGGEPPNLTTSRKSLLEFGTTVVLKHVDCANQFLQDKLAEALATSTLIRPVSTKRHPLSARVIFTFRNTIPLMKKKQKLSSKLFKLLEPMRRIHLSPLRERREDILPLTRYYAMKLYNKFNHMENVSIRNISADGSIGPDLLELLANERWEDNVRDLVAFIHSLVLLPFKQVLLEREKLEFVKMAMMIEKEHEFSLPAKIATVEGSIVNRAVQKLSSQKSKVAQLLGLSERAVGRKINALYHPGHFFSSP